MIYSMGMLDPISQTRNMTSSQLDFSVGRIMGVVFNIDIYGRSFCIIGICYYACRKSLSCK